MNRISLAAIAAGIFFLIYRLWMNPRRVFNSLTGWSVVVLCLIGIPAATFGVILFLQGLHLPAIVIFIGLCILWLLLVPA